MILNQCDCCNKENVELFEIDNEDYEFVCQTCYDLLNDLYGRIQKREKKYCNKINKKIVGE